MNLDALLAPHADALRRRSLRTSLIATNIANADTPHYKARDVVFGAALTNSTRLLPRLALTRTAEAHAGATRANQEGRVLYRIPEGASLDGNTVDKDQEQARFAENAMRYQASLQFAKRRVDSLVRVLRGE